MQRRSTNASVLQVGMMRSHLRERLIGLTGLYMNLSDGESSEGTETWKRT